MRKKEKEKEKGKRKVLKFGGEFVVIGLEGGFGYCLKLRKKDLVWCYFEKGNAKRRRKGEEMRC